MSLINFDHNKGSLTVDIVLPEEVLLRVHKYAADHHFSIKKKFHITPIGFALGRNLGERHRGLFPQIEQLAKSFDWQMEFHNKYYRVKKHFLFRNSPEEDRESIVVVAHPTCLEEFWMKLNELLGEHLELPFPHVTLATKSNNPINQEIGIGIQTFADFQTFEPENITEKLS